MATLELGRRGGSVTRQEGVPENVLPADILHVRQTLLQEGQVVLRAVVHKGDGQALKTAQTMSQSPNSFTNENKK